MKVGIMQPYFVPYIGYWQLMNAVDKYVVYDDVNYIKGGWINRNRILNDGQVNYFNIILKDASPNRLIRDIQVDSNPGIIGKNLRKIEFLYKKAPQFPNAFPIIEDILLCGRENLVDYLIYSFERLCDYMGIGTQLIRSSSIPKDNSKRGQEKVIEICEELCATEYYNAIGGQALYSFERFRQSGIELKFLKTGDIVYQQFGKEFQSNLSIIDVLMFCSRSEVQRMLNDFTLISGNEGA